MEWKHADIGMEVFLPRALETSLVEWKHAAPCWNWRTSFGLGNFLSGMETTVASFCAIKRITLETSLVEWKQVSEGKYGRVLNSLETSLVEWKPLSPGFRATPGGPLGNFLSGMETGIRLQGCHPHQGLGNFLSGMETQVPVVRDTDALRPWKLP